MRDDRHDATCLCDAGKNPWACLRTGSTGEGGDRQPNNKERCDTLSVNQKLCSNDAEI